LTSKALGVQSFSFGLDAAPPKLKLWTPTALGVQSFSFGLDAARPKLKLWTPTAFGVHSIHRIAFDQFWM